MLREDLRDPLLRERGQRWINGLAQEVERRLGPGAEGLGELVVAHWQGTLTIWGFTRATTLADAVRTALTRLIAQLPHTPDSGAGN